jgi:hypothetical protein
MHLLTMLFSMRLCSFHQALCHWPIGQQLPAHHTPQQLRTAVPWRHTLLRVEQWYQLSRLQVLQVGLPHQGCWRSWWRQGWGPPLKSVSRYFSTPQALQWWRMYIVGISGAKTIVRRLLAVGWLVCSAVEVLSQHARPGNCLVQRSVCAANVVEGWVLDHAVQACAHHRC